MITSAQELTEAIKKYNNNFDENLIHKIYVYSFNAHALQKRASGDMYFTHPLEVAKILIGMRMDPSSIAAGLLHDVVEDTEISIEEIKEQFGTEVATLVENLTKINKIQYTSSTAYYAENFRKFLIATAADLRVLLIKLADRLHNLRTIDHIKDINKRKRIAVESIDIYAPLATLLGPQLIKDEIEDISFKVLYPEEYAKIMSKLHSVLDNDKDYIKHAIDEFKTILDKHSMEYKLSGRLKTPYSIWKKIESGNFVLDQVHDIFAFRVLVNTPMDCYTVVGMMHMHYQIIPGRFKDYISIPKINNYQSIHTTLVGPKNNIIELQVRTHDMHRNAEYGVAAHLSYKHGEYITKRKDSYIRALKELVEVVQQSDNQDVMQHAKMDLYGNKIFCFSKDHDVITLPKGATVIDFAYHIHTHIGNSCIGAKVNGSLITLKTVLNNGDYIEIITSSYQKPEPKWLNYATTGKARMCIKKFIYSQKKAQFIKLGYDLTKYLFSKNEIEFSETKLPLSSYQCDEACDFYLNIATGIIPFDHFNLYLSKLPHQEYLPTYDIYILDFIPDIAVHYAQCCHPMLNDRIIGCLDNKNGLIIHNSSCDKIDSKNSLIEVLWTKQNTMSDVFIGRIRVILYNKQGVLAKLANAMYQQNSDISNIKIESRNNDFIELTVEFKAENLRHFTNTVSTLKTIDSVASIHKL